MNYSKRLIVSGAFLFAYCLGCVHSLAYESAKEGVKCFDVPTKTDLEWMNSVKRWYYIAMHRLDLYEFSANIFGKDPKDIQEDEVYYDSCISWTTNPTDNTLTAEGFHGHKKTYYMKPQDDHFGKLAFIDTEGGIPGASYVTLTDNNTFQFCVTCFADLNEMVWNVASPYKSLPKETMKIIHEHAQSFGFKEEYFTGQRYDHCKDANEDEDKPGKNEL